ncbi:MAG TPA: ABC transporter substrate-binding protein [Terriglobales bacterium]|nr:ABC transporter substrate-binding protein [Terriglobales bacterium]
MKLTGFQWIVISSVLTAGVAVAATRPHYGGTLHIQMASTVSTLDPTDSNQVKTLAARNLFALIFDTLVVLNDRGEPQPGLAISWHAEPGNQSWQFVMRPGVRFSDQTQVTPELVAVALRRANPQWKVTASDTTIAIQLDAPSPNLPSEIASARNGIAKVDAGKLIGTGPFVVSEWDAGKKLVLTAREDYWGGRPFLDSVEIEMARGFHDQTIAHETGQAQLIEVPPELAHQATLAGEVHASEPTELVALLFARDVQSPEDAKQRQALSLSIDRAMLNRVVFQGGGEPAGGLLPGWLSGYGFLFTVKADLPRAQQLRAEVPQAPLWSLGFDANDPLARLLAQRIALNANDAGLRLQLANQSNPDIRLVRVGLVSLDSHLALAEVSKSLGIPAPHFLGNSADDLYHAENAMLQSQRVIPLLHLETAWAVSKTVRNWEDTGDGTWQVPDVWLTTGKP